MARIYVASSWRNPYYPEVVKRLKAEGHDVYDFRNPPHGGSGFHWTDVDENAPNWTFEEYAEGLRHPLAERQFAADLEALKLGGHMCSRSTLRQKCPHRGRMDCRCRETGYRLYSGNGGTGADVQTLLRRDWQPR